MPDDHSKETTAAIDNSPPVSANNNGAKKDKPKRFAWVTWEHSLDIIKIVVTFYAACIGTFVTMQFNDRQHELAKMEAIAQMLPHLVQSEGQEEEQDKSANNTAPANIDNKSADGTIKNTAPKEHKTSHLARDGAMWAIFRTANNKTMLRDLASLFPEDIYRVVSSIAASGSIKSDPDAVTALQVASEKLAGKYSSTDKTELASRLYSQAVHLKQQDTNHPTAISIVDLNDQEVDTSPTHEHIDEMLISLNKLADMHKKESEATSSMSTGRWTAKQMYKRVRTIGLKTGTKQTKLEVVKADIALSNFYLKEHKTETAIFYMKEALSLNEEVLGRDDPMTTDIANQLNELLQLKKKP